MMEQETYCWGQIRDLDETHNRNNFIRDTKNHILSKSTYVKCV